MNDKWYAVPGYKGAKGIEGQPHVVNQDGELIACFEAIEDAEAAAKAVNKERGHD